MKTLSLAALLWFGACAAPPPEPDLLERAMTARGGSDAVLAGVGHVRKISGKLDGLPFEETVTFTPPNRLRVELAVEGIEATRTLEYDGRQGVRIDGDQRTPLEATQTRALRNRAMDEAVLSMCVLDGAFFTVELLEEPAEFHGVAVESMNIAHTSGYLRTLHFDPDTADLVGFEGQEWSDLKGGRRAYTEIVYSEFVPADPADPANGEGLTGQRRPGRVKIYVDGTLRIDARIVSFTVSFTVSFATLKASSR